MIFSCAHGEGRVTGAGVISWEFWEWMCEGGLNCNSGFS